jgi:subtilisin-like proprotein convertase family protein
MQRVLFWVLLSSALGVVGWSWFLYREPSIHALPGSHKTLVSSSSETSTDKSLSSLSQAVSLNEELSSKSRYRHRLSNTTKTLGELIRNPRAILLENALLDLTAPVNLKVPSNLSSASDPGAYIVQSRSACDDSFRRSLSSAGARLISYIPNNAFLILGDGAIAQRLTQEPQVSAVIPYEPYYKIKSSLLDSVLNVESDSLLTGAQADPTLVSVLLFEDGATSTLAQLKAAGLEVLTQDRSPFGVAAILRCSLNKVAWIACLPGVLELERARARTAANDLSRARIGTAVDPVTASDYLGLTGSNVLVNVNDLGIDANHPDLAGRVLGDVPSSFSDTDGHGTHVAGIIASSGAHSLTVTNAPGSLMPPASTQFRGLAPAARIFSIGLKTTPTSYITDGYLQQTAAQSSSLISNNSWNYADDDDYDLGAASYDAAVRDALPGNSRAQALLFVFPAGNVGRGTDDGNGGTPDSIQSPGTAKNVITVGAIESPRWIANQIRICTTNGQIVTCQTNTPWLPFTDSSNQVAGFSSRGNVGLGIEGPSGRFKPDVVAPGTFLVSTRSTTWDQAAYYSSTNHSPSLFSDAASASALSNLNNGLGPFYRFESGTSQSAAEVSGMLALMQEFFEQRLLRTNSPALMKALLINGAREVGTGYDLHSASGTNSQGWGLVQLPNSLPPHLTASPMPGSSMWYFDQSSNEALATAQQRTRFVSVTPEAQNSPLRVTLAWTDPPGNPVASLKLVNDLDLVVTNLQTGEVFWGNDLPPGSTFNSARPPGTQPVWDLVNNVENVYLAPTLGSNYSITVQARRVGVNAVADHPDGVVQDFALVISSGNAESTNALTVTDAPISSTMPSMVTVITNSFGTAGSDTGSLLLHQLIGANNPLQGTNQIPSPVPGNTAMTVGTPNQWHFYVFTNDSPFTNAAFLTFLPQPLSLLPSSGDLSAFEQIWTAPVDLDLYVSRNPALTNLDPAALGAADMSLGRGGSKTIVYSNAVPGVYYVGVKCESLQGAEYGFAVDFGLQPFAQADAQGNELLRGFPAFSGTSIGTPTVPSEAYIFHVTPDSFPVRRVIVTNIISYSSISDWSVVLEHHSSLLTLKNFSTNGPVSGQVFVYDDSNEGDMPGALPSDGPGNLRDFASQDGSGQWDLTLATTNQPATNQASMIFLERQQDLIGAMGATVLPGSCRQDYLSIPMQATNLAVTAVIGSGTGPIQLQVYPLGVVNSNCISLQVTATTAGGTLILDATSNPPLNPGSYTVRTCNLGPDPVGVTLQATLGVGTTTPPTNFYNSTSPLVITDAAVCSSTLLVTNTDHILSAEVGVRLNHPRVSDLALSLIAPDGERVLLDAGRGAASDGALGANLIVTNTTPVSFTGGPEAVTNIFDTGQTSGTIIINYDFFFQPDEMRVYYETNLLYDSGLISFKGSNSISYGPGNSTSFTVVMNEGGNTESNTTWFYSVTSTHIEPLYLTFTENTNLTLTPVKFAPSLTNFTLLPGSGTPSSGIFYLPEESMEKLTGKSAAGPWTLEIWDTRVGATNPVPELLTWQLALVLDTTVPNPVDLASGAAVTNLIGPGQIQWYEVDVPGWVSFVTNSFLNSTSPLNVLFNANTPPTGTNSGDLTLAHGVTSGLWVLQTNATPGLSAGSPYFIGVENTNSVTVDLTFRIDLDITNVTTLLSGVPYSNTNSGPLNSADFYRYVVSSNALRVQFEINAPTSDLTLVARKGAPLPNLFSYDFISSNPGTNDELIVVSNSSEPVPLSAGEWLLSVINVTGQAASYSIMATEYSDYGTNLAVSAPTFTGDSLCFTWSSLPGIHYFLEGKAALSDPTWDVAGTGVTATDYFTTSCVLLPSSYQYFRVSEGLVLVPVLPIINSFTPSANGYLMQWNAPTNSQFVVQWASSLAPATWQTIPGNVTSTNGTFLFFDDGSQTGGFSNPRFYRLGQIP